MDTTDGDDRKERPRIDLTPAIGEGGSEVEQLGYQGIPDTGPIVGPASDAARAADDALEIAAVEFPTD